MFNCFFLIVPAIMKMRTAALGAMSSLALFFAKPRNPMHGMHNVLF